MVARVHAIHQNPRLAISNNAGKRRLLQRSGFAGCAAYGFAKSQHRFVWGVRLVLLTDVRGLPLGYTLVPANEKEKPTFGCAAVN